MKGTYEVTLTSNNGVHVEKVWACSHRAVMEYAEKEAVAYGASYEVERKSFPRNTKIKTIGG